MTKVRNVAKELKEGDEVIVYDGSSTVGGIIGEISTAQFYIWQNTHAGTRGTKSPETKGYRYSWVIHKDSEHLIEIVRKGGSGMESVKKYFNKHQDTLITLGIVVLIDNYLFNGQLREKIQQLMEKILVGTEKALTKGE